MGQRTLCPTDKVALEATTPIWPVVNMLRVPPWPSQGEAAQGGPTQTTDVRTACFEGAARAYQGPWEIIPIPPIELFDLLRDTTPRLRGTPRRTSITTTDLGSSLSPANNSSRAVDTASGRCTGRSCPAPATMRRATSVVKCAASSEGSAEGTPVRCLPRATQWLAP